MSIEHHKNKALVWHPIEKTIDGETIKFYAEAEDILSHLPKIGIPMIMRRIEKGEGKGTAKAWSYPGMEKLVQTLRKKIDGVSELFTLDACRHDGMTELEASRADRGPGPRSLRPQDRAGLSRLCQGNDAARTGGDAQAACASVGAEAAGRTRQHGISKWRAETISKGDEKPTRKQGRFGKEFSTLTLGWGARTRTWEWRNQNPSGSRYLSKRIPKKRGNSASIRSRG